MPPADYLPLTPAVLHILLALAGGDRHGYAIAQEVESLTDGRVRMGPGTLYGSIERMDEGGLLERAPRRDHDDPGDERRVYYRLTRLGERVLELELERLNAVVELGRERHVFQRPEPA